MPNKNNNYESKSNLIKKPKSFSGNRNSRSDKTARGKFGNNYSTNRNSSNNKDSFNDKGSFIKKDDRSFSNDRNYSKNTNSFNDRSSFRKKMIDLFLMIEITQKILIPSMTDLFIKKMIDLFLMIEITQKY